MIAPWHICEQISLGIYIWCQGNDAAWNVIDLWTQRRRNHTWCTYIAPFCSSACAHTLLFLHNNHMEPHAAGFVENNIELPWSGVNCTISLIVFFSRLNEWNMKSKTCLLQHFRYELKQKISQTNIICPWQILNNS